MNEEELKFYYQNDDDRKKINQLSDIRTNVINHIRNSVEGKDKEDRDSINSLLQKENLNLSVEAKNNNRFTYYYYNDKDGKESSRQIMLTFKYDSLWNYKTNGFRIDMYLEIQGNILRFVESHKELLKGIGIEADPQSLPQNGWWHFQKDEIRFTIDDLLNPYNIRTRIIEGIKSSALYNNGAKIIEYYMNAKLNQ